MKKIVIFSGIVVIAVATVGIFMFFNRSSSDESSWKTVEVTSGTVKNVISSTGTLNPVSTIDVGTQVSGTIVKVFADYNDEVKKNQIIAEIDRQPLLIKLTQVQASCLKSEALYEQAKSAYSRDSLLHIKGLISDEELLTSSTNYRSQKATLDASRADVEIAKTNLNYATIRSPVDGLVIERSVENGQTVAASLSAPTLFVIAENLQKMEILADVDESDIGKIKTGQSVTFTVPAYPDSQYNGIVKQIRLQPKTSQNVVTYTVVIEASNQDGTLLPGMTANVDFIVEKADNVFTVASAALRFKPSADAAGKKPDMPYMSKSGKPGEWQKRSGTNDSTNSSNRPHGFFNKEFSGDSQNAKPNMGDRGMLWTVDENNKLRPIFVKTGISDGTITEIRGREIKEGLKVVTGVNEKKKNQKKTASKTLFGPPKQNSSRNGAPSMHPPGGF